MKETIWRRLVRGGRRLEQRPDWAAFAGADWADRIMQVPVTDRFHAKQGRSVGRWVLQAGGRELVVYLKRHYRLPWWRGLLALVWPDAAWSPGLQEWRHLEQARAAGLPVPEAVAVGQYVGPGVRLQSFLAVEELTGMLPLHEAIPLAATRLDPAGFAAWKRGLLAEMARLTRALHQRRWFHKDLYLCHFYVAEADTRRLPPWPGRVRLIDLHRLGHHPWTWRFWRAKDLAQLLFSSAVEGVTARERLRFWRLYLGEGRRRRGARWLRRWIQFRAERYHRHERRRLARENGQAPAASAIPPIGPGGPAEDGAGRVCG
jgi:heptose I phosphotransferase